MYFLMEKAGFFVDVVTTDEALWNRFMWKTFNISEENISCEHVGDNSRRLWFCSDFLYLIKNWRNFVIKRCQTWTPDGIVKLSHWDSIVEMKQPNRFNLKISPKLCHDDIHPKLYQKMNVGRAYQYIKDFICYLEEREAYTKANNIYFLSDSTSQGLKITLKSTLEILSFLCTIHGFQYLMTSKLNQDALVRFFGIMRSACVANGHPDSRYIQIHIQMFRLMSTYSLVKPPRSSNDNGSEMLNALLNINDVYNSELKQIKLQDGFDKILDRSIGFDNQEFVVFVIESNMTII